MSLHRSAVPRASRNRGEWPLARIACRLRTGRAQEVEVSQTAAGLMTASYLYFYAQPSGEWGGCHGFDQTMAAEGSVKPQRKAYLCGDGRHIFLHGGFPKLKKGLTDFLKCECKVDEMAAKVAEWKSDDLERAMQAKGLCATKCDRRAFHGLTRNG